MPAEGLSQNLAQRAKFLNSLPIRRFGRNVPQTNCPHLMAFITLRPPVLFPLGIRGTFCKRLWPKSPAPLPLTLDKPLGKASVFSLGIGSGCLNILKDAQTLLSYCKLKWHLIYQTGDRVVGTVGEVIPLGPLPQPITTDSL